jgi:hypothetical protein
VNTESGPGARSMNNLGDYDEIWRCLGCSQRPLKDNGEAAQGRFANGLLLPMRKRDRMCETQGQGFRIH